MEPAVAALAHALYEMACGFEGDAPRPSVFPPACPPALLQTLQHLFRPPALAKLPLSLDAVAEMPFFQRVAPRRPGAADAPLPGPDRASRALLIKMGLLHPSTAAAAPTPPQAAWGAATSTATRVVAAAVEARRLDALDASALQSVGRAEPPLVRGRVGD